MKRDYRTENQARDKSKQAAWQANYRLRHKNKASLAAKRANLKAKYGITYETFLEMHKEQKGLCAICGQEEKAERDLAVDHCHTTGRVRALLCTTCNIALGGFKDDPQLLLNARDYILTHSE